MAKPKLYVFVSIELRSGGCIYLPAKTRDHAEARLGEIRVEAIDGAVFVHGVMEVGDPSADFDLRPFLIPVLNIGYATVVELTTPPDSKAK